MFIGTTKEASAFKSIFKTLNDFVLDLKVDYDSDGMRFNMIDNSHALFINCEFDNYFKSIECDEPSSFIVDCGSFNDVLKLLGSGEFSITADEFAVVIEQGNSKYRLTQSRMMDNYVNVPTLSHTISDIHIPIKDIKKSLKDSSVFGANVEFYCIGNKLKLHTDGTFGETSTTYTLDDTYPETTSQYLLNKLNTIFSCDKVSKEVIISFSQNAPLHVAYDTEDILLEFLLAPFVDYEDEDD